MSDFRAGTHDISIELAIYDGQWRVLAVDPHTGEALPFAIEYVAFPKPERGHHAGANEVYVLGPFSINVPPDAIYEARPSRAAPSAPERSSERRADAPASAPLGETQNTTDEPR